MSTARTRLRAVTRAAGAAGLVVVLAACGSPLSGNALSVGSTTVSDGRVTELVTELHDQLTALDPRTPFDEGAATASTVDRLTRSLLLDEAAVREGIVVTPSQVDQVIEQTTTGNFGGDRAKLDAALASQQNIPASQVPEFARDFLIQKALGEKLAPGGDQAASSAALVTYLSGLSTELGAEVSPRFGTWDSSKISLAPVPNDLSKLAVVPVSQ